MVILMPLNVKEFENFFSAITPISSPHFSSKFRLKIVNFAFSLFRDFARFSYKTNFLCPYVNLNNRSRNGDRNAAVTRLCFSAVSRNEVQTLCLTFRLWAEPGRQMHFDYEVDN